jgi:tetratricopeptide (TPR) repeat protein
MPRPEDSCSPALAGAAVALLLSLAFVAVGPPAVLAQVAPPEAMKPPTFELLAGQAAKAKEAGRLDEAIDLYRRALKKKPSSLEARWALATLLYDKDRFKDAREQFSRVVEARPADGQARALRGLCQARLGNLKDALVDLMAARTLGIPTPAVRSVAFFQTAVLLNKLGDPDGAFEVLRPLAVDGDDRPAVIEAYGLIMLRLPLMPEEIAPDQRDMILLAGRGGYHMARARRSDIGRLALEELVSRYPATPNVHYALGMYLLQDDPAAGIAELRKELRVSPDHYVAMIQIALSELKRGRGQDALPVAEKAVSLAPNVPAARLAFGRALLAVGQPDRAVSEMEAAVRLAPENPRLHFALAQTYAQAGRPEDAARERAEFLRLQKGAREEAEPGDDAGASSPNTR